MVPIETVNKNACDDLTWYGDQGECDEICFPVACTEVDDHFGDEFSSFVCEC